MIDKLTGKINKEAKKKLPPIQSEEEKLFEDEEKKRIDESELKDQEEAKAILKKKQNDRNWVDLDKYIELLLDSKSDDEIVFVYLNPNDNGDPYDLKVVVYLD